MRKQLKEQAFITQQLTPQNISPNPHCLTWGAWFPASWQIKLGVLEWLKGAIGGDRVEKG
jgi:hypothetical protein